MGWATLRSGWHVLAASAGVAARAPPAAGLILSRLLSSSFINFDGLIARWNVRHCREVLGSAERARLELGYLHRLGPDALPALRWLSPNEPRLPAVVRKLEELLGRRGCG